ncbi:MAG: polysaccharide deacetylase family protein [Chloroflexi bacterium]|nr:polysaccharide deacetylase family protein [Chloroflexota bacterium]
MPTNQQEQQKKSPAEKIFEAAEHTGLIRAGRFLSPRSLTVLNYHRINHRPDQPGSDTFKPNISATPEEFTRQMEYLSHWFNVVSLRDVIEWLDGRRALPSHAALITFDDGYLDNYTIAFPILHKFNFPAVIFLTTGHIEKDTPFYWDLVAYCFYHTKLDQVQSLDGKTRHWNNGRELDKTVKNWTESLKTLPDIEKQKWLASLPDLLNVSVPQGIFRALMMNWDQIRELNTKGIEFGAHTTTHPILTRVPLEQARSEIEGSKAEIESNLDQPIFSFAYPNGMSADFNPQIEKLVANAGFKAAFTLLNGPTSLREAKRDPFAIRRIFISHKHTLPRFAALSSIFNRYLSSD